MDLKNKEFVGIVGREVVIKDINHNYNESFFYAGKIFSTEKDSLLMFYANDDIYYIWQHCQENKVINDFYDKDTCFKFLHMNLNNILTNKALEEY